MTVHSLMAAALLVATPPADPSPLIGTDHVPDWIEGAQDEEHRIWIDSTYRGQFDLNGQLFPTVLVRSELIGKDGKVTLLDIETVVDCSSRSTAIYRTWMAGRGTSRLAAGTSPLFATGLFREEANARGIDEIVCKVIGTVR